MSSESGERLLDRALRIELKHNSLFCSILYSPTSMITMHLLLQIYNDSRRTLPDSLCNKPPKVEDIYVSEENLYSIEKRFDVSKQCQMQIS
jgi:hypothetical protein